MGKKFKHLPLVVKQAKTKAHAMSAATLQVQLCEYRFSGDRWLVWAAAGEHMWTWKLGMQKIMKKGVENNNDDDNDNNDNDNNNHNNNNIYLKRYDKIYMCMYMRSHSIIYIYIHILE